MNREVPPSRPGTWVTFQEAIKDTRSEHPEDRILGYSGYHVGFGECRTVVRITSGGEVLALRRTTRDAFGPLLHWVAMESLP